MQQYHEKYMRKAIRQAQKAKSIGEVPIGCIIVQNGIVIARGWNKKEIKQQSISHAEIEAIQQACRKLKSWRLDDCDLYVTLEPCAMCTGAIIQSRLRGVYFGAYDPKGGAVCTCEHLLDNPAFNHHPVYQGGILQEECSSMLTTFFRERRKQNKAIKKQKELEILKSADENSQNGIEKPAHLETEGQDSDV